jgi:hypothetical protein
VLCDEASGLLRAIPRAWPAQPGASAPVVDYCRYHLRDQLYRRLHRAGLQHPGHPLRDALDTAFHGVRQWDAFSRLACGSGVAALGTWLDQKDALVREQLARHEWPVSIGALEERLRSVKTRLFDRRRHFTNHERMNRLLGLIQLDLNGQADEYRYTEIISEWLANNAGRAAAQRAIFDPRGAASLRS